MNRIPLFGGAILLAVVLIFALSSFFTVPQGEMALVLRFGAIANAEHPVMEPGLHMKKPFIEDVVRFDARLLDLDPPAEQMILADQKRLEVDTYTRFRINDPILFYQSVRSEEKARERLREIVNNSVRRVLGNVTLPSVLSGEREQIMHEIQHEVSETAKQLGLIVVDVRIRRADLPPETSQAIFRRMESERQREAAEARAQGAERAQQIRASAERERTIILAEAQRAAQILRGEGDNEANRAYADAYGADPAFFAFYRSLGAYKQSMGDGTTTFVLTPDSDFFQFFGKAPGHH